MVHEGTKQAELPSAELRSLLCVQLAGIFASCGDRHIINYLPGSLSSEENLQMYRNDYSDNEPDIPGCRRRSVPVRSGAPQFALWASAADRPRNVMHSWQSTL